MAESQSNPNDPKIPLPDPDRVQRTVNAAVDRFRERRNFYIGLGVAILVCVIGAIFWMNLRSSKTEDGFSPLWQRCEAVRGKLAINLSAKAELEELEAYLDEVRGTSEEGLCMWFLAIYNYREASTEDKLSAEDRRPYLEKALSFVEPLYKDEKYGDLFIAKPNWYTAASASPVDQLHAQIKADLKYDGETTSAQPKPDDKIVAVLRTSEGDIYLHFFRDLAPKHVNNFVTLAINGVYNGTAFHFVGGGSENPVSVHAGDPYSFFYNDPLDKKHILRWGKGGAGYAVSPEEARFKIVHREGIVTSLRRERADWDNAVQFQVMLDADPGLDRLHTPFAKVVEGMSVVRKAAEKKTAAQHGPYKDDYQFGSKGTRDLVVEPVIIHKVVVFEDGKVLEHTFPLTDGEKSLGTLAQTPVTPLKGDELVAGRKMLKPTFDGKINLGTDFPFPEDVDMAKEPALGARAEPEKGSDEGDK